MIARLGSWWKKAGGYTKTIMLLVLMSVLIGVLIFLGYFLSWGWTGFKEKTLWDWLNLLGVLAIPAVVGLGAAWYTAQQGKVSDRENTDNQREAALQAYLDKMAELLLKEHLGELTEDGQLKPEYEEVRKIARVRTLTVLSRLDSVRKRSVLQFLYEAHLINILDWSSADLNEAALSEATLIGAHLNGAHLSGANLSFADLSGINLNKADLRGVNLSFADLSGAKLSDANVRGADLTGADLSGTDLSGASLKGTKLNGTNLSGANLSGADLSDANLSKIMHWHTVSTIQRQILLNAESGGRVKQQVADLTERWENPLRVFLNVSSMTVIFKNGTNLSGANLSEADLSGANLKDANLKDANLTEAKMSRVKRTVVIRGYGRTDYPKWADLEKSTPVLSEKGLLSNEEAKNLLEKLEKSDGNEARFTKVEPKKVRIRIVRLEAKAADLTGADLTGADLSGVNLRKTKITHEQWGKAGLLKGATMPDGSKHP